MPFGDHSGRQSVVVSCVLKQDESTAAANIPTLCTNSFLHSLVITALRPHRAVENSHDRQQSSNFVTWSLKKEIVACFPLLLISSAFNAPQICKDSPEPSVAENLSGLGTITQEKR